MSVVARAPDGTIRLYCKGSDAKVMKKIRGDTPADLMDNTNANLHYFAKQARCCKRCWLPCIQTPYPAVMFAQPALCAACPA